MARHIKVIVYPVKDLEAAKAFYTKYLGVEPYADAPYYVGYRVGDQEIGLDPNGTSVVGYVEVSDIEVSLEELRSVGAVMEQDVKDVGGGLLIAQVKDADGNVLGFRQFSKQ